MAKNQQFMSTYVFINAEPTNSFRNVASISCRIVLMFRFISCNDLARKYKQRVKLKYKKTCHCENIEYTPCVVVSEAILFFIFSIDEDSSEFSASRLSYLRIKIVLNEDGGLLEYARCQLNKTHLFLRSSSFLMESCITSISCEKESSKHVRS